MAVPQGEWPVPRRVIRLRAGSRPHVPSPRLGAAALSEARRPARRPGSDAPAGGAAWPGLWGCVLTALLSGAGCWVLVAPRLAADLAGGAATASALAAVAPAELPDALGTLSSSAGLLERLRRRQGCQALAVVTLAAPPGAPPARIRLRSGAYYSPAFTLAAAPVRVAIPYPAPPEAGHGVLSVLSDGGAAVLALSPPWLLPTAAGEASRGVTWQPDAGCAARG